MKRNATIILFALLLTWFVNGSALAHPPTGVVVDRLGNIYFSDLLTIWKLDKFGKVSVFRPGTGAHVHELSIDADGNVYGTELGYQNDQMVTSVWKMSPAGNFSYLLAPTSNPPRGISHWLDRDGNMYAVEQNNHTRTRTLLLRRSVDGNVITLAGGAYGQRDGKGTGAMLSSIGGFAFGPDGSIYLTDANAVRKVTMDGTVTTVGGNLTARTADDKPTLFGDSNSALTGLTVDASGNVYVADQGNRRVLRVTSDGKSTVVLRLDPPYFPNGVTTSPDGSVYVLEFKFTPPGTTDGARVEKIAADGSHTVIGVAGTNTNISGTADNNIVRGRALISPSRNRIRYGTLILAVMLLSGLTILWYLTRKRA